MQLRKRQVKLILNFKKEKCNRHVPKPFSKIQLLKKKEEKTGHKMMIKRGKIEKTSETKCKSKGRSYSAPKPVWELLLVRQLQIILGEKLFGPQARFTSHEKCISRNRKNANKEKVENFFNSRVSPTIPVSHSCKNQNKIKNKWGNITCRRPNAHAPQEGVKCHQNTDQQIGKFKNWNSCVHNIYLRFIVHYFCSPYVCLCY